MSLSGPEALRSIEEALRDIRREEDDVTRRLARSAERLTKIRESEGELFRKLAAVRLDPATQAELSGLLGQAEMKARDTLRQHAESLAGTESELKALDKAISALGAERAVKLGEVTRRQEELKAISTRIAGTLAQDAQYQAKRKAAADLARIAREAIAKTNQADLDREAKGRPYRDDPLFSYLWEIGYGTRNYATNPLFAWLDGKVARMIGFDGARRNFVMLNEIPLRLREYAERQAESAANAQAEVDAHFDAAIDAAGGAPIRAALKAAEAEIAEIDARIVATEDDRDDKAKAQRDLAQGSDPAFASAIAALGEALGREDIQRLVNEARQTRTAQDDTLIAQIDGFRQRGLEEESDARDLRERLRTLAARRRELEDIQYEFKKSRYDDPRSTFKDNGLVGDLLTEFLRGAITAAVYWETWQRSQNWTPGPGSRPGPWGDGGFSWPDNSIGGGSGGKWGRPPSPGGFSRPRTGTQGTRRHGTFKTGGGF